MSKYRQSVTFSDRAARTVERLADEQGTSVSEVVRDALAREEWFRKTKADGGRVLVQEKDGTVREVVFVE